MNGGKVWALILAAGDGTRLSTLTTTASGVKVPKQFCSLRGGPSLLEEALQRAEAVTGRQTMVAVVADPHRRWWERALSTLASDNLIVQPENRGTAVGLLLPLLHILRQDPQATVVVLPSDHFFLDEAAVARSLKQASRLAQRDVENIYMLGLEPAEPDPELGYIVPEAGARGTVRSLRRFVEKPSVDVARELIAAGAMLNMFILAASARALVALYAARQPALVDHLRCLPGSSTASSREAQALRELYPLLPKLDFSRDILEGQEASLRVLCVPACGWSDLGTPRRVAEALIRLGAGLPATDDREGVAFLSLAEQHRCRPPGALFQLQA